MIEHKQIVENERAVLVGLIHRFQTETQLQEYLHELAFLAETAGAVTEKVFFQKFQAKQVEAPASTMVLLFAQKFQARYLC